MAGLPQSYPARNSGVRYRHVEGRFVGINGANPTTKYGQGFTVARSGEGVWVVTFEKPCSQFVTARAWATDDDTNFHEVTWTLSAANRTLTITHKTCTYATIVSAGPAAQDVVDEIGFCVCIAESDVPGAGV